MFYSIRVGPAVILRLASNIKFTPATLRASRSGGAATSLLLSSQDVCSGHLPQTCCLHPGYGVTRARFAHLQRMEHTSFHYRHYKYQPSRKRDMGIPRRGWRETQQ
jgi:hypothetical protein